VLNRLRGRLHAVRKLLKKLQEDEAKKGAADVDR
jgi:hypothetical protein